MLLRRKNAGRVTVISGCVGSIVLSCVTGILMMTPLAFVTGFIFAVPTLILAAIKPTKQWIEDAPAGGFAPYGYR